MCIGPLNEMVFFLEEVPFKEVSNSSLFALVAVKYNVRFYMIFSFGCIMNYSIS